MIEQILDELRSKSGSHPETLARALAGEVHAVQIGSRWEGRVIYVLFSPGARGPVGVLKVDHHPTHRSRLLDEWDALTELARHSAMLGRVPDPLALVSSTARVIVAQSVLPGVSLGVRMRRRARPGPRSTARDHRQVTDWLALLHSTTTRPQATQLDADRIIERVDRALPLDVAGRSGFLADLGAQTRGLSDLVIPSLWSHSDLGPSNLFVTRERAGVIDWEHGLPQSSPLPDLIGFLTLYARAVRSRGRSAVSLEEGFRRAFVTDGWLGRVTAQTLIRDLRRHDLPPEAAQPLLASTLAEIATGQTAKVLSPQARATWRGLLSVHAVNGRDGVLARAVDDSRRR